MHFAHTDLPRIAHDVLLNVQKLYTQSHIPGAFVVALTGELGAGKTTLMQHIAAALGIQGEITSPTFVIMKSHVIPTQSTGFSLPFTHLIHIDAYRIEDEREMQVIGIGEILSNPHNLICIEWPERIPSISPHMRIQLTHAKEEDRRTISIDPRIA